MFYLFRSGNTFDSSDPYIRLADAAWQVGSNSGEMGVTGSIRVFDKLGQEVLVFAELAWWSTLTRLVFTDLVGSWHDTTDITGLRFYFSSGNVESGTITLYGIVK